jgi:hypothetical protein
MRGIVEIEVVVYARLTAYHAHMETEPTPTLPSDADTERYEEIVRGLFPDTKEERQRHEALWEETKVKTE